MLVCSTECSWSNFPCCHPFLFLPCLSYLFLVGHFLHLQSDEGGVVEAIFRCIGVSLSPQSVEVVAQEADAGQSSSSSSSSSSSQYLTERLGFSGIHIGEFMGGQHAPEGKQYQVVNAETIQELLRQHQVCTSETQYVAECPHSTGNLDQTLHSCLCFEEESSARAALICSEAHITMQAQCLRRRGFVQCPSREDWVHE
ncbi:hypothetical protein DUNSADRAFT_17582 [Dunaliella salina]|uniref:Uncharacterized protein n=1 Tax=Dunaliella salina TaxID=3046 RepID=A0ABQ7G1G9_DUNSA|nr:hypothetical protein DUNSADRAFT_17582 [Dunaliella salina]|eukprot:KAF5828453.1 hypothetical protein DUNSADRAFT_17582 [Dunaliella salina]